MKKLVAVFVLLFAFTFSSCVDDEDTSSTIIKVKVIKSSEPVSGVTVCLFNSTYHPESKFFIPMWSFNKEETNSDGFAVFDLEKSLENIDDIEALDSESTFYFGVFDGEKVLGKNSITIKKGENKELRVWLKTL